MATTKPKVEVEKPVFCVVEQTKLGHMDRYRVVHYKNLKDGKLTIEKVEYTLVTVPEEAMKPSINAHAFREYCRVGNAAHAQQYEADKALRQEQQARQQQADRAQRAEKARNDRKVRWQERRDGARNARIVLREQDIARRKMEEAATGEKDPALRHLQRLPY